MPDYSLECPSCGESNPATARFCGNCQTQLSGSPQPAPVARAQSAHLAGSQPTSISATAPATKHQQVWGWITTAWGVVFLLIGFSELSEGDIDFGLLCLACSAPIYGGINLIRNRRLFGVSPVIIAIALVALSFIIFGMGGDSLDDISPT